MTLFVKFRHVVDGKWVLGTRLIPVEFLKEFDGYEGEKINQYLQKWHTDPFVMSWQDFY